MSSLLGLARSLSTAITRVACHPFCKSLPPPLSTGRPTTLTAFSTLSKTCSNQQKNAFPWKLSCTSGLSQQLLSAAESSSNMTNKRFITLEYMHRKGLYKKVRKKKKSPLDGRPQMRGIVLKTLIKKPKKPNSANRKCVRLRLTNGKEVTAYVPGEGHNLQEHNIVLVQGGRLQDTPGVKLTCIRGKYDLAHVKKK